MKNNISTFINNKNIFNKANKNENKKDIQALNKLKIINNNNKGKCFLVNLKFVSSNNISLPKAKTTIKNKNIKKSDIFPVINFNQNNLHLNTINSVSLSKNKKIAKLKKNNTENNKYKTINLEFNLHLTTNNNNNSITNYKNKTNYINHNSLQESSYFMNTKKRINEILEKINKRYFAKLTTINHLNELFYGNRDNQDIKYINLSKIKLRKNNDIYDNENNNIKISNIYRYKTYAKKVTISKRINTFSERNKENSNEINNFKKINVNEKIQKFRSLKMDKCKDLVNNALKDLVKTRENNLNYIENFKKSCDFKYEDFLNKNL